MTPKPTTVESAIGNTNTLINTDTIYRALGGPGQSGRASFPSLPPAPFPRSSMALPAVTLLLSRSFLLHPTPKCWSSHGSETPDPCLGTYPPLTLPWRHSESQTQRGEQHQPGPLSPPQCTHSCVRSLHSHTLSSSPPPLVLPTASSPGARYSLELLGRSDSSPPSWRPHQPICSMLSPNDPHCGFTCSSLLQHPQASKLPPSSAAASQLGSHCHSGAKHPFHTHKTHRSLFALLEQSAKF